MEAVLTELEAALGHGFGSPELLICALTHRSLANQQMQEAARTDLASPPTMNVSSFWVMRCLAW